MVEKRLWKILSMLLLFIGLLILFGCMSPSGEARVAPTPAPVKLAPAPVPAPIEVAPTPAEPIEVAPTPAEPIEVAPEVAIIE